ncbi:MAG: DsbA family protein [Anaerolineales bacterium]|nr:DsbA family protein [Anaerolineales bacterium]
MEELKNGASPADPDVTIQWRSYELRPRGAPPMPPEYRVKIESFRPQLLAVARERYGREINQGPFGIDTRPALIGEKYAQRMGKGAEYHDAVMAAYWRDALDISDRTLLGTIAGACGLDEQAFLTALDDEEMLNAMLGDASFAQRAGIQGVPALVFNQRYLVSGAQPAEVLRNVVAQIVAENQG